jgi:hypothetical protein
MILNSRGFAKLDENALKAKKWSIIAYLAKKLYLMPLKYHR